MADSVEMPAMGAAQAQSWHALMELYDQIDHGWALIGGQLVHLHCAERGVSPMRPTDDVDTVVDIRASTDMLETFTGALADLGFEPEMSGDGVQHRWRRDLAQIDVLIPEGVGERARQRVGVGGAPTVSAPGTTQALTRTEPVAVVVGDREGTVLRPNLVAALVGKAAARTEIASNRASVRHSTDFVILASLISARDFRETELSRKDKKRLRAMVERCRHDTEVMAWVGATTALDRLGRAAELG
ncbi:hypothetical protein JL108_15430 [Aeromicrobium sp. YIM 150415]|uniref:hypothetical protein n=1 Tax=Aeromicrobium sp. YIM 150415 TaxID=2803912 RepID=UPI001962622B|nr:hypothetical protein [Aeromicrobium sp. YIM 150415]MBM9464845.1 hypothetical protein [Aeromicrobium sp. YIM 150415]